MSTLVFTEPLRRRCSGEKGTRLISFRRHRPRVLDARSDETPRKRSRWTFYERSRPLPRSSRWIPAVDAVPPPSSLAEKPLSSSLASLPLRARPSRYASRRFSTRRGNDEIRRMHLARSTLGIRLCRRLSSFGAGKKQGQRVGTSRRTRRDALAGSLYRVALFFR